MGTGEERSLIHADHRLCLLEGRGGGATKPKNKRGGGRRDKQHLTLRASVRKQYRWEGGRGAERERPPVTPAVTWQQERPGSVSPPRPLPTPCLARAAALAAPPPSRILLTGLPLPSRHGCPLSPAHCLPSSSARTGEGMDASIHLPQPGLQPLPLSDAPVCSFFEFSALLVLHPGLGVGTEAGKGTEAHSRFSPHPPSK